MKKYKIEPMDYEAEYYLKNNTSEKEKRYTNKDEAWDHVLYLETHGYGEFCVVEVKDE